MDLLPFIGALFSSDAASFLLLVGAILGYVFWIKPMRTDKKDGENLMRDKVMNLPNKDELKVMLYEAMGDIHGVTDYMSRFKVDMEASINVLKASMENTMGELIKRINDGELKNNQAVLSKVSELKENIEELIRLNIILKENNATQTVKISTVASNIGKLINNLTNLYNLVDHLIEELENKKLINKVDRRIMTGLKGSMDLTRTQIDTVSAVLLNLVKQNSTPENSRVDKIYDEEKEEE